MCYRMISIIINYYTKYKVVIVHTYIHTYIDMYIYTHAHTYTHIYIIHIHTYNQIQIQFQYSDLYLDLNKNIPRMRSRKHIQGHERACKMETRTAIK